MSIEIMSLPLGMTMTNAYLVGDSESQKAIVIDPGWDGKKIVVEAENRGWEIKEIWLTHGHFDHLGGVGAIADGANPPAVALHPEDRWLWEAKGGAAVFGIQDVDPGPEPSIDLKHGQILTLGETQFEVRHAPGHTPGHVMFYCEDIKVLFCGDVIFRTSIGRTDLPNGDHGTLLESIRTQVLALPDETRLLNGHGPETTVGFERAYNPFL
jgi:glyoxylase-like metal-dependent hydrolase (beta-lactamase superfamily II)